MKLSDGVLNSPTHASIGILLGGALWGLMWWPIRVMADIGLWGMWPPALIYVFTLLLMLPIAVKRRRFIAARWRQLAVIGLLSGSAFTFYTVSLLMTEVVRSLLLFYLTPVWGTILGIAVLGERPGPGRVCAILLGLGGLLVILGLGNGWPLPRNGGDWLALLAGVLWAFASLKLYQMGNIAAQDQMLAFVSGGAVVSVLLLMFGGSQLGGALPVGVFLDALPYAFLFSLYFAPTLFLTLWPATILTPGRAGLLLMSEVVVGVFSAALFANEVFGFRELVGTLLITTAAAVEVLWRGSAAKAGGS